MPLIGKDICKRIGNETGISLTESRSVNASNNAFYKHLYMGNINIDAFTHLLEANESTRSRRGFD